MEGARAEILESKDAPLAWRLRAMFLRELIAKPSRLRLFASALRLYQTSGLRSLAESVPLLRDRALLAPTIGPRPFTRTGVIARPTGKPVKRVAFLTGCIMPLAYGRVHRATVRVLARNGCEVIAPPGQVCCGALHAHAGLLDEARALARTNVAAFRGSDEPIVVNSAGCGALMKEYGHLLGDEDGEKFGARVRDVTELLAGDAMKGPAPGAPLDLHVAYDPPCHLLHAQGVAAPPLKLFAAIPLLELVQVPGAAECCGSAGLFTLLEPEMSRAVLAAKLERLREAAPQVVATGNPGCLMQLGAGLAAASIPAQARHPVELLDDAYRAAGRYE
jgi:glycolate oxidase iron-sulfur subunit